MNTEHTFERPLDFLQSILDLDNNNNNKMFVAGVFNLVSKVESPRVVVVNVYF